MNKKGIIGLLLISTMIMTMIGCGNKAPKNIDEEIYKKSIEMLAYTERCYYNNTKISDDLYDEYVKEAKEIYQSQNRDRTKEEKETMTNIVMIGFNLGCYQITNKQETLDYYKKNLKKAKEVLNIPTNKDSNEVWDKIKDK